MAHTISLAADGLGPSGHSNLLGNEFEVCDLYIHSFAQLAVDLFDVLVAH